MTQMVMEQIRFDGDHVVDLPDEAVGVTIERSKPLHTRKYVARFLVPFRPGDDDE